MSLKDTIRGAREEAAASGSPFQRTDSDKDSSSEAASPSREQGFARRSAARSKPSREASAGVRVVSANGKKSKADMTKEEKKAERKRERETEDRRYNVSQMILDDNEQYQAARKVWKRILGVGVAFIVVAVLLYFYIGQIGADTPAVLTGVYFVFLVLSYVAVIASFIYDWRRIKPLREQAERRTASMSEKRLKNMLNRGSGK